MRPTSALALLTCVSLSLTACDAAPVTNDAFAPSDDAASDAFSSSDDAGAGAMDASSSHEDAASDDDAAPALDAASADDAFALDAPATSDAASTTDDAASVDDAFAMRRTVFAEFCPSTATAAGLYRGTLASNLNDIAGACTVSAPGRDGSLRVMLSPGQTLTATYRHAGDGVVYLLERCPVVSSCVASADTSTAGAETLRYTHDGAAAAPFYLVLDSASTTGPQTFELDLDVTGP